jgi:AhpD family alkylhydroperoxidase
MTTAKIDPALGLIKEFNKATNGSAELVDKVRRQAIFSEGAVAIKYKTLSAVLWSISARCEPCIAYYVQQAVKHGATEADFGEFLALAGAMGGCVGEMWALKAYKAFKGGDGAAAKGDDAHCCA